MNRQFFATATAFALLAVGAGRCAAGSVGAIYTFDDLPPGTTTPLNYTVNGVTAQFTGDANTTCVVIANPSFTPPFSGNILMAEGGHLGVDVTFSTPINKVSVDVGGVNGGPGYSFFGLAAYSGGLYGTGVGGAGLQLDTTFGQQQAVITFSSNTPFDAIVIQASPCYYTYIDNVAIGSAAVPEPAGLTLASVCIRALAVRGWRGRRLVA